MTLFVNFHAIPLSKAPLLPTSPLGAAQGDGDPTFKYHGHPPLCNDERSKLIAVGNERTLRSLISGVRFEGANRAIFDKPGFLFGDADRDEDPKL